MRLSQVSNKLTLLQCQHCQHSVHTVARIVLQLVDLNTVLTALQQMCVHFVSYALCTCELQIVHSVCLCNALCDATTILQTVLVCKQGASPVRIKFHVVYA